MKTMYTNTNSEKRSNLHDESRKTHEAVSSVMPQKQSK